LDELLQYGGLHAGRDRRISSAWDFLSGKSRKPDFWGRLAHPP
jgi:hypothetical protein